MVIPASPKPANGASAASPVTLWQWTAACAVGLALSLLLWHEFLHNYDLTGGDTWSYLFPQKIALADSLARNQLPLWHDLTGLGYPLLAESQAGVFYPSNQILYRLLDVNHAYYTSLILHYTMAFVFAWRFARCQLVSHWSSLLVALVFVYGWFPARVSLEWSIIGGVWLPLTLWLTHEFLVRPSRLRFAVLTTCLAVHLLAGHFALAFINQLCLLGYTAFQLILRRGETRPRLTVAAAIPVAVLMSMALSAAQLLPSMELKLTSQRDGAQKEFDPGYGHMPPVYLTQLIASWTWWHSDVILMDRRILQLPGSIGADTNPVEAHFYLGLIPLLLAGRCLLPGTQRRSTQVNRWCWISLGILSVIYATGWLLPVTGYLPGFAWFMGPGRYTIVATLAGAILAGLALDTLLRRPQAHVFAVLVVAGITWTDLHQSSRMVADAVPRPSIFTDRDESWVRDYFYSQPARTCRLLASGPNVGNIFGVSCLPVYLGIGPSVYFSDRLVLETQVDNSEFASPQQISRLQMLGVTHLLTTDPADQFDAVLERVGADPDVFLNRIWGEPGKTRYLYKLREPGQRLGSDPPGAMTSWKTVEDTPQDITFEVELNQTAQVNLKELMYPGWTVEIDGQPVDALPGDSLVRSVRMDRGTHILRWYFESAVVRTGICVSGLAFFIVWMAVVIPIRRHTRQQAV